MGKQFKVNKPKPFDFKEEKDIKKAKKHYRLWGVAGIFALCLLATSAYGVKSFFDKYYIVSPIQTRDTVIINKASLKPKPSKTPTPTKKPVSLNVAAPAYASEPASNPGDLAIARYIASKDWDYSVAIRVAKSENFWNLTQSFDCSRDGKMNSNGTYDHGLFQINDVHIPGEITLADTHDCYKNIDEAYRIWQRHGWSSWSAYNNGSYLNHSVIAL